MREIELNLKESQQAALDILNKVSEICESENFTYFEKLLTPWPLAL